MMKPLTDRQYMRLSGKIGGYLGAAGRCDAYATVAETAGNAHKAAELRERAAGYRKLAESARQKRGPRRGHWRQRLKQQTGKTC